VAAFLDAPVKDVKAHWPKDAVEVEVEGQRRWMLDMPDAADGEVDVASLLGPFDLFMQAKDRELLVPDAGRRKAMWPVIGRPGGVLVDGELVGSWRPRASGRKLSVQVDPWVRDTKKLRARVEQGAEQLAAYRGVDLKAVTY
jgi:hypothetical protein